MLFIGQSYWQHKLYLREFALGYAKQMERKENVEGRGRDSEVEESQLEKMNIGLQQKEREMEVEAELGVPLSMTLMP